MGAAAASADIVSRNPADPTDQVGVFAPGGGIDVDRAVTAARSAAAGFASLPGQARADALSRAAARVEAAAGGLADLIRREVGKPIVEARAEVARTAAILRYQAQAALDPDGDTYPSADGRSLLYSRRRPRGVVALITPWNFPVAIPAWKLAPALAYGNVCVWKPSSFAPACAEALYDCLAPELPDAAVQIVQGRGRCRGGARRALGGGRGVVHGIGRDGPGGGPDGRRPGRVRAVRDGRAERLDRARRRRPGVRRGHDRRCGDGLRRPEVHRHEPRHLRHRRARPHARCAGGGRRRPACRGPRRRCLPGGAADLGRGARRRGGSRRARGGGGRPAAHGRRRHARARELPRPGAGRGLGRDGRAGPGGGVRARVRDHGARPAPTPPSRWQTASATAS